MKILIRASKIPELPLGLNPRFIPPERGDIFFAAGFQLADVPLEKLAAVQPAVDCSVGGCHLIFGMWNPAMDVDRGPAIEGYAAAPVHAANMGTAARPIGQQRHSIGLQ
jgi:hypothetical protein